MKAATAVPLPPPAAAGRGINKKELQVIYPQYIDSALRRTEGRRVTKINGVVSPTAEEVYDAVKTLGFTAYLDMTKSLPCVQCRHSIPNPARGCVRVAIKAPADAHYVKKSEFDTATRESLVDGLETKGKVMARVAEMIEKKPGRKVAPPPRPPADASSPKQQSAPQRKQRK